MADRHPLRRRRWGAGANVYLRQCSCHCRYPDHCPPMSPPPERVSPASLASPLALEQRLAQLRFDVTPDGVTDDNTRQGLIAFQKLHGLPRTGQPTPDVVASLAEAKLPPPLVPGEGRLVWRWTSPAR
ncbi:MAG: peptidoglycan-binding protein [Actinomycetota bacterium]|nr:peptidoglycan-binding protein [Actinomycetota bacterium]MDQ3574763.1 peptidoglycan-binding protein [Actinomycetota bacterium]